MKPIEFFKALSETKEDLDFNNDEIKKSYDPFIINKYFSMIEVIVPLVNQINQYEVPKASHYRFYLTTVPKRKQYFNYIKNETTDQDKQNIRLVAEYYQVGLKEAQYYINKILSNEQLTEILNVYKYGQDQMIEV